MGHLINLIGVVSTGILSPSFRNSRQIKNKYLFLFARNPMPKNFFCICHLCWFAKPELSRVRGVNVLHAQAAVRVLSVTTLLTCTVLSLYYMYCTAFRHFCVSAFRHFCVSAFRHFGVSAVPRFGAQECQNFPEAEWPKDRKTERPKR